jgi:hypothetical protein
VIGWQTEREEWRNAAHRDEFLVVQHADEGHGLHIIGSSRQPQQRGYAAVSSRLAFRTTRSSMTS